MHGWLLTVIALRRRRRALECDCLDARGRARQRRAYSLEEEVV